MHFNLGILAREDLDVTSKNDEIYDYFFSYVLRLDINNFDLGRNRYEKKNMKILHFFSHVLRLDISDLAKTPRTMYIPAR